LPTKTSQFLKLYSVWYMLPILDVSIIIIFLLGTLTVGLCLKNKDTTTAGYLLGGRALSLPAFVATTVSTYYGGILGVGEYGWKYGISNWLVFGVPYYFGALAFALLLCRRARQQASLTLPQSLATTYGAPVQKISAGIVFLTSLPATYMLIMGTLISVTFGIPSVYGILATAVFIVAYLWRGGFSAVTKTDFFQCIIMFGGFIMLLIVLLSSYGVEPLSNLPPSHLEPTGGQPIGEILIWYIIALSTLAEPNFFQRAFAAKTPNIARNGLLISILCWTFFDAMTTTCALYARALLPNLKDPLLAFPELAQTVLPTGLLGFFFVGMFATVMSTLDSKIFTVATTFGCDLFAKKIEKISNESSENLENSENKKTERMTKRTRIGLILAAILSVLIALSSKSVVELWKIFGSVSAAALLIPIISTYYRPLRMRPNSVILLMVGSSLVTIAWFISKKYFHWVPIDIEPLFAGCAVSITVFLIDKITYSIKNAKNKI